MALNLKVKTAINFNEPVTMQELKAAVSKPDAANASQQEQSQEKTQESVKSDAIIKAKDVKMCKTVSDNRAVKDVAKNVKLPEKTRRKSKKVNDEAFEKIVKGNSVRKYTKEMQNRDAIAKKSKAMRKKARTTASNYDDKFAEAAAAPTKQFDSIIYGSATTGDAEETLNNVFSDVMSLSE